MQCLTKGIFFEAEKMKEFLDKLVKKYETKEFIKDDPIRFPHRYKTKNDIEISALISALFAFGKREVFIQKLDFLFDIMQNEPYNFICTFDNKNESLKNFVYRFVKGFDLICFLESLNKLYCRDNSSIGELFFEGKQKKCMLEYTSSYFYSCLNCKPELGFCHLFARPENGGAMKRMNMFLRWMVRKGPVDLGIWDFIKSSELLIPLDVHVGNVSRSLGLLKRNANDFKSVIELTQKLREFDDNDPIKYDFALFGAGINSKNK